MKLQLSVFAQDLAVVGVANKGDDDGNGNGNGNGNDDDDVSCNPFAVIAEVHSEPGKAPTVIGKTEVLKNTNSPDWTKIFILNNFNLGRPMHILVTIQNQNNDKGDKGDKEEEGNNNNNNNKSLGSAMFEVGSVLGTKGGVVGKELKSGGIILANVERCSGSGTLNFQMRGIGFKSRQAQIDAFFELQRKRTTTSGDIVWDTVFRSRPIMKDENPIWDDCCVELSVLTGGKKKQKFRVVVKDYDDGGGGGDEENSNNKKKSTDSIIGYCRVTVNELLSKVTPGADSDDVGGINMDNAILVAKGKDKKECGHLVVVSASENSDGAATKDDEEEEIEIQSRDFAIDEDIIVEAMGDTDLVPDELVGGACFADYISGGCQLRVIVAIDFTASNGDPRKEDSLHHFKKDGMNQYQTAMAMICDILSEYDSDQKYPVWGFGAKRNGTLDQCFRCGKEEEAEGVEGILEAYKDAFKSGIAMSSPTDITEVVKAAGKNARECLAAGMKSGNQEYSILAIFTNGSVHSAAATIEALDEVKDDPLSIVVIGVGPGDFGTMQFLNADDQSQNKRVHFVDMKKHQAKDNALTEETLKDIPQHLVEYFSGQGINPNPPAEPDDIVIEPFSEDDEVEANVVVTESGDIQVTSDAKPPAANSDEDGGGKFGFLGKKAKEEMMKQGKRILARQKKQFGKVQKKMQQKVDRMIDQQMKQVFKV